jgi:hypothetical protein
LDSEIFISNVKAQGLYKEFQEGRMALVPNQASANKKSTLTPPRMARAIILLVTTV